MIPNPYTWLAGVVVTVCLFGATYLWGRTDGRESEHADNAALVERKNLALRNAAAALGQASIRFREISALAAVEEAESKANQKLAADLAREAGKETTALVKRIGELNAAAERERETCTEAEMRICGSPLY